MHSELYCHCIDCLLSAVLVSGDSGACDNFLEFGSGPEFPFVEGTSNHRPDKKKKKKKKTITFPQSHYSRHVPKRFFDELNGAIA